MFDPAFLVLDLAGDGELVIFQGVAEDLGQQRDAHAHLGHIRDRLKHFTVDPPTMKMKRKTI